MRLANVPPPMALQEIEVSSNIIDVAITVRYNGRPRTLIGVLHHQGYSQFEWSVPSMSQNLPICRFMDDFWSTDIDVITNRDRLYLQTSFSGDSSLLFSKSVDKSTLTVIGEDAHDVEQILLDETDVEGMVRCSWSPWSPKSKTYLVLDHDRKTNSDGQENRVQDFNDVDMAGIELSLSPFSTQRVDAVICNFKIEHPVNGSVNGIETLATKDIIFSLAENGSLFANERRLARSCTSFLVTPAHLIFTTSQHLLKFVHLTGDTEGEFSLTYLPILCSNNIFNRS